MCGESVSQVPVTVAEIHSLDGWTLSQLAGGAASLWPLPALPGVSVQCFTATELLGQEGAEPVGFNTSEPIRGIDQWWGPCLAFVRLWILLSVPQTKPSDCGGF